MALFAVGSKLAFVNVGMAVGAFLTDVRENWLQVALCAHYALVHAAQRIARLRVIKLGDIADRFPSSLGMTILTGNIQRPVWASRVAASLRLRARR